VEGSGALVKKGGKNHPSIDPARVFAPRYFSEVIPTQGSTSIIVNDENRVARTNISLPILLDEMNRVGFQDQRISAVISDGTHRLMPQ
jgi:nickel-dependent lactate racemase